jgi:hypothetical protein
VRVLFVVALAAVVVGAYWGALSLSRDYYIVQSPPGSVFNSEPEGLAVLYRYLEELGMPVATLHSFDELPAGGTIVVAADHPFVRSPTVAEGVRLSEWVEAGGRVVLVGPMARDVLSGAVVGGGTGPMVPDLLVLEPRLPSAYTDGVEGVLVGRERLLAENASWATHLGDGAGQVMMARAHGEGEIVWLAGILPLSNRGIAEEDNARFATLLTASEGPVYFDEYHHGFVSGGGIWQRLRAGGRAASVLVIVALGLMLFALAQRFGRAIEPAPIATARTGAHITSLAELYRKAGARPDALATLEEGLRLALVRRYGSEKAGRAANVAAAKALDDSVAVRTGGSISEERFKTTAGALARARREVEGLDE